MTNTTTSPTSVIRPTTQSNGWIPNPGETPCAASGTTNYTKLRYSSDGNEPYGCLTDTYTPSGYHRSVSYNSNCGTGLPTSIVGDTFTQPNDPLTPSRTPTLSLSYNPNGDGLVTAYGRGGPHNATWQINYTANGSNRIRSVQDPNGVTSYSCYNVDGSIFYSESAKQNALDSSPSCPSEQQFNNGTATPPTYATAYGYDADGNAVTVMHHHNCPDASSNCTANNPAKKQCNSQATLEGMTCNFYDGIDRLVEVRLPYDCSFDIYENHWITRYLYDLTGSDARISEAARHSMPTGISSRSWSFCRQTQPSKRRRHSSPSRTRAMPRSKRSLMTALIAR